MTHYQANDRSYGALILLFFQGFRMRALRSGKQPSKDGNFVKGKPMAESKAARNKFFAAKKTRTVSKKLTPLQRRMQSGGA